MKAGGQTAGCKGVARSEAVPTLPRAPAGSKSPLRRWHAATPPPPACGRGTS